MIKIKLLTVDAVPPTRGSRYAAGLDLYCIDDIVIPAHGRALVSTGIAVAIPQDCYGRIAPRSKLANKLGIDVMAGVIDSDYRGEIKVLLHNITDTQISFPTQSKIAQLIVERIILEHQIVEDLGESDRGESGINDTDLRVIVPPDATHISSDGSPHKLAVGFWRVYVNGAWKVVSGTPHKLQEITCTHDSEQHY